MKYANRHPGSGYDPGFSGGKTMRLLIDGAQVWDGTGAAPFPGKVLINGERIAAVAPQSQAVAADGAEPVDATGKFLMPGKVEGHSHLSIVDVAGGTARGEPAADAR